MRSVLQILPEAPHRHCEEAKPTKQSRAAGALLDCFAALAMTTSTGWSLTSRSRRSRSTCRSRGPASPWRTSRATSRRAAW
ncbi:MAG: hypothetical protein C0458_06390 [Methylobacterium sp.]|nr:hypothetical protein [Methylobacterium sp.]